MADQLRAFLTQTGKTQREIAAALGITEEHLSRVLNGRFPITASFKGHFAEVYGYEAAAAVFSSRSAQAEAQV
jgi:transcriptional regulator with XRE-family HTH domain